MSLKAYKAAQVATEDPRVTEYRLFGQVTGALLNAKQTNAGGTSLVEAVDWNRRLWRTLAADCMDDRNTLTQDVRAKIISLAIHPYLSGQPHRIKYLEAIYDYVRKFDGVLHWNGEEILDWYLKCSAEK